ncbi:FixH family protein [Azospirillum thermophilum]|uniref:Copper resistance protein CopC n=1 Tax=Azospirillum thermophilum TaxID=2202148 RepID=A0A2S2CU32_9PROT|nr:FixH family protein [Azospirillum thermophilum]AWK87880.1 hypothetical protein DEW08_18310 [Azospirillum thermophilum]
MTIRRILRAAAILAALLLPGSGAALAHAVLVESVPADGTRVDAPPSDVRLRFNEPVSPVAVTAIAPGGKTVPLPEGRVEDETLHVPLPPDATAGTWLVSYRVTSADGHPVAGSILFGIGTSPDQSVARQQEGRNATLLAALAARAVHYGSLLAALGGGLFLLAVRPERAEVQRAVRRGQVLVTALAAFAVIANLGLAGAVLQGASPAALLTDGSWIAGLASSTGVSSAIALAGLLLLAAGYSSGSRAALALGALVATAALAATGHAATAPPRWASAPLVVLHGLAAGFWLGALWPLLVILRRCPRGEAALLVRRFSAWALAAVALLTVAGAGLSLLQIPSAGAVAPTLYGQLWLTKLVAVAALLALAAYNRFRLTPALDRADGVGRLGGSIRTELVTMGVVLVLTAGLGTTPPPRTLAGAEPSGSPAGASTPGTAARPAGFALATQQQGRTLVVEAVPARIGRNSLTIHLAGPDGMPLSPKEVTAELSLPSAGVEPVARPLTSAGPGIYRLDPLELPAAGDWSLRLDVLVDDFDKAILRVTLPVGGP